MIPYLERREIFGELLFQLNGGRSWRIRNVFPFCHGIGMGGALPHLLLLHLTARRIPVKPRLWNFKSQNQWWKEELSGVIQLSIRQINVVTFSTAWERIVEKSIFFSSWQRWCFQEFTCDFPVLMQQVRKINLYTRMKREKWSRISHSDCKALLMRGQDKTQNKREGNISSLDWFPLNIKLGADPKRNFWVWFENSISIFSIFAEIDLFSCKTSGKHLFQTVRICTVPSGMWFPFSRSSSSLISSSLTSSAKQNQVSLEKLQILQLLGRQIPAEILSCPTRILHCQWPSTSVSNREHSSYQSSGNWDVGREINYEYLLINCNWF